MTDVTWWPWAALLLLGAAHGVNPAMGWLLAVGMGLQEQDRRAVWRALGPLAAGHAVAIAAALMIAIAIGGMLPIDKLKWGVAALLLGLGVYRLVRHRHPRLRGMRVSVRELAGWSFLMASAHGAGLMAVPFALDAAGSRPAPTQDRAAAHGEHAMHERGTGRGDDAPETGGTAATAHAGHGAMLAGLTSGQATGLVATAVHSAGYLLVTALVGILVFEKLGVGLLRTAWINVDLIWSGALIVTGLLTPFI
jgi:hypothetical protein